MNKHSVIDQALAGLDLIRDTDDEIGHVWKLPDEHDSVRFAVTETSEAVEEMLILETYSKFGSAVNTEINNQGKDYARNNAQTNSNLAKELTDVGMMILKYFLARDNSNSSSKEVIKTTGEYSITDGGVILIPDELLPPIKKSIEDFDINPDTLSVIGMSLSYAMMLTKSVPGMVYADIILASALFLVISHDVFKETSFVKMLKEKLTRTKDKVNNREMNYR